MPETGRYMTVGEALAYLKTVANPLEPVFVLRGQDRLAVPTVFFWAQIAEKHGVDLKKISGAWLCAEQMAMWPNRKLPD